MNDTGGIPRMTHPVHGMRILVVDDNDQLLQATKFLLEHHGGIIRLARNGAEAIALLRQEPFDCVLMDLTMPGMGGLEATARIRADADIARVRVIGMTGHADGRAAEQCLAAGMDDVITKPFDIDTLYTLLARPAPD